VHAPIAATAISTPLSLLEHSPSTLPVPLCHTQMLITTGYVIPINIIDDMSASVFSKVNILGYNPKMIGDPEVLIAAKGKVNSGALPKWFLTLVRYSFF
jgi:hypothetical protein